MFSSFFTYQLINNDESSMLGILYPALLEVTRNLPRQCRELNEECKRIIEQLKDMDMNHKPGDTTPMDNNADKYFHLLKQACEVDKARVRSTALDTINKLLSYKYLTGNTEVDAGLFPVARAGGQAGEPVPAPQPTGKKRLLIDVLVELLYNCAMFMDDNVQLSVLKCILTAIQSSSSPVHDQSIILSVRACFHIFITSMVPTNRTTAKATVIQIVTLTFKRMDIAFEQVKSITDQCTQLEHEIALYERENGTASTASTAIAVNNTSVDESDENNDEEKEDCPAEKKPTAPITPAVAKDAKEPTPLPASPKDLPAPPQALSASNHPNQIALKQLYHNLQHQRQKLLMLQADGYQILRSLGRQGIRPLSDPQFTDPPQPPQQRNFLLALELLLHILKSPGHLLASTLPFLSIIRDDVLPCIAFSLSSSIEDIFKIGSQIFQLLVIHFRAELKYELNYFFKFVIIDLISHPNATFHHKVTILDMLMSLLRDRTLVLEFILNGDLALYPYTSTTTAPLSEIFRKKKRRVPQHTEPSIYEPSDSLTLSTTPSLDDPLRLSTTGSQLDSSRNSMSAPNDSLNESIASVPTADLQTVPETDAPTTTANTLSPISPLSISVPSQPSSPSPNAPSGPTSPSAEEVLGISPEAALVEIQRLEQTQADFIALPQPIIRDLLLSFQGLLQTNHVAENWMTVRDDQELKTLATECINSILRAMLSFQNDVNLSKYQSPYPADVQFIDGNNSHKLVIAGARTPSLDLDPLNAAESANPSINSLIPQQRWEELDTFKYIMSKVFIPFEFEEVFAIHYSFIDSRAQSQISSLQQAQANFINQKLFKPEAIEQLIGPMKGYIANLQTNIKTPLQLQSLNQQLAATEGYESFRSLIRPLDSSEVNFLLKHQQSLSAAQSTAPITDKSGERTFFKETPPHVINWIESKQTYCEFISNKLTRFLWDCATYTFNTSGFKNAFRILSHFKLLDVNDPRVIAQWLYYTPDLNKAQVGEIICGHSRLCTETLKYFITYFNFKGYSFDEALREYLQSFRLSGEAQGIDRTADAFGNKFCSDNPGIFRSPDTAFVLAFSCVMLNTDLHSTQITNKMTKQAFFKNNSKIDQGFDLDPVFLDNIYNNICMNEIKMKDDQRKGWVSYSSRFRLQMFVKDGKETARYLHKQYKHVSATIVAQLERIFDGSATASPTKSLSLDEQLDGEYFESEESATTTQQQQQEQQQQQQQPGDLKGPMGSRRSITIGSTTNRRTSALASYRTVAELIQHYGEDNPYDISPLLIHKRLIPLLAVKRSIAQRTHSHPSLCSYIRLEAKHVSIIGAVAHGFFPIIANCYRAIFDNNVLVSSQGLLSIQQTLSNNSGMTVTPMSISTAAANDQLHGVPASASGAASPTAAAMQTAQISTTQTISSVVQQDNKLIKLVSDGLRSCIRICVINNLKTYMDYAFYIWFHCCTLLEFDPLRVLSFYRYNPIPQFNMIDGEPQLLETAPISSPNQLIARNQTLNDVALYSHPPVKDDTPQAYLQSVIGYTNLQHLQNRNVDSCRQLIGSIQLECNYLSSNAWFIITYLISYYNRIGLINKSSDDTSPLPMNSQDSSNSTNLRFNENVDGSAIELIDNSVLDKFFNLSLQLNPQNSLIMLRQLRTTVLFELFPLRKLSTTPLSVSPPPPSSRSPLSLQAQQLSAPTNSLVTSLSIISEDTNPSHYITELSIYLAGCPTSPSIMPQVSYNSSITTAPHLNIPPFVTLMSSPTLFLTQKYVEVMYYLTNSKSISIEQRTAIYGIILDVLRLGGCHPQSVVNTFVLTVAKQLCTQYLSTTTPTTTLLTSYLFSPFEYTIQYHTANYTPGISDNILEFTLNCLEQVIKQQSQSIHTGWGTILRALMRIAQSPQCPIHLIQLGYQIMHCILTDYFSLVTTSNINGVLDMISSLSAFTDVNSHPLYDEPAATPGAASTGPNRRQSSAPGLSRMSSKNELKDTTLTLSSEIVIPATTLLSRTAVYLSKLTILLNDMETHPNCYVVAASRYDRHILTNKQSPNFVNEIRSQLITQNDKSNDKAPSADGKGKELNIHDECYINWHSVLTLSPFVQNQQITATPETQPLVPLPTTLIHSLDQLEAFQAKYPRDKGHLEDQLTEKDEVAYAELILTRIKLSRQTLTTCWITLLKQLGVVLTNHDVSVRSHSLSIFDKILLHYGLIWSPHEWGLIFDNVLTPIFNYVDIYHYDTHALPLVDAIFSQSNANTFMPPVRPLEPPPKQPHVLTEHSITTSNVNPKLKKHIDKWIKTSLYTIILRVIHIYYFHHSILISFLPNLLTILYKLIHTTHIDIIRIAFRSWYTLCTYPSTMMLTISPFGDSVDLSTSQSGASTPTNASAGTGVADAKTFVQTTPEEWDQLFTWYLYVCKHFLPTSLISDQTRGWLGLPMYTKTSPKNIKNKPKFVEIDPIQIEDDIAMNQLNPKLPSMVQVQYLNDQAQQSFVPFMSVVQPSKLTQLFDSISNSTWNSEQADTPQTQPHVAKLIDQLEAYNQDCIQAAALKQTRGQPTALGASSHGIERPRSGAVVSDRKVEKMLYQEEIIILHSKVLLMMVDTVFNVFMTLYQPVFQRSPYKSQQQSQIAPPTSTLRQSLGLQLPSPTPQPNQTSTTITDAHLHCVLDSLFYIIDFANEFNSDFTLRKALWATGFLSSENNIVDLTAIVSRAMKISIRLLISRLCYPQDFASQISSSSLPQHALEFKTDLIYRLNLITHCCLPAYHLCCKILSQPPQQLKQIQQQINTTVATIITAHNPQEKVVSQGLTSVIDIDCSKILDQVVTELLVGLLEHDELLTIFMTQYYSSVCQLIALGSESVRVMISRALQTQLLRKTVQNGLQSHVKSNRK